METNIKSNTLKYGIIAAIVLVEVILSGFIAKKVQHAFADTETIPFSFSFQTKVQRPMVFSLFYATAENEFYCEEKKIDSEVIEPSDSLRTVTFNIQTDSLAHIRLDFYENPGKVWISDIQTNIGKTLSLSNTLPSFDIDSIYDEDNGHCVISTKPDPYIYLIEVHSAAPTHKILSSYLFVISFIASLIFLLLITILFRKIAQSSNYADAALLVFFFVFISIPALLTDNDEISTTENRTLAKKPEIKKIGEINTYGRDYENWLSDHFGGRRYFIGLNNRKNELFEFSEEKHYPNAFYSRDNWMFLKNDDGFLNLTLYTDEELRKITDYLNQCQQWCDEHNVKLFFIMGPDKDKIYGEYYTNHLTKFRPDSESRSQQLFKYLKEHSKIKICDPTQKILETKAKSDTLLYWKNDTHWNYYGCYIAYQELMKTMSEEIDIPTVYKPTAWVPDVHCPGDLNAFCPTIPLDSTTHYLKPDFETISETYFAPPYFENVEPSPNYIHSTNPNGCKGRVLILGDSFSDLLHIYMERTFEDSHKIRVHNADFDSRQFTSVIRQYVIDNGIQYIVYESTERFVPIMLQLNF